MAALIIILLTAYYLYCVYASFLAVLNKRLKRDLRVAALLRIISAGFMLVCAMLFFIIHLKDEVLSYSYTRGTIKTYSSYGKFEPVFFTLVISSAMLVVISAFFDQKGSVNGKTKVRNVTVSVIMAFSVLVMGLFIIVGNYSGNLYDYQPKYFRFDSPDKSRSIVICETSWKHGSWGDIYQIKGEKAEKIGRFETKGGLRNEGEYVLDWSQERVKIKYHSDPGTYNNITAQFVEL